jgi:Family of unknown function (DUF6049)
VNRHPLTHRTVRAWLALVLVAGAALYGTAAARPASADQSVTVSLTTMTPTVATASSAELNLAGQLAIPAGTSHDDVIVQLAYSVVDYRSQMSEGPDTGNDQQLNTVQDTLGALSSGSHPWSLQTSISSMGLTPGYVYALDIQAYSDGGFLGALRTYLPYEIGSGPPVGSTKLTVLAPVTAPSPIDGYQESISGAQYYELTENSLAQSMGPTGSLYQLLAAGAQLPKGTISWVVDPDLLNSAMQIEEGYIVASGGTASDAIGPDASNAGAWLKEVKTVLGNSGSELWQLPTADPDLGSLAQASSAQAQQLVTDAARQSTSASSLSMVKSTIGRSPQGLLAWPADGQVSPATLTLADSIDPAAVVADSDSIGLSVPNEAYTPTGRASADGKDNLVVGDDALDAIMSGDSADSGYDAAGSTSSLLVGQRLLAQTALISMEKPNLARTVMVTLPRDSGTAVTDMDALKVLQGAGWIGSAGLSTLLKQSPDPDASTGTPTRSAATTATDLSTAQLDTAFSLASQLQLYQSILTGPDPTTVFAEAVPRTVSTGWRGSSAALTAFESAVSSRLRSRTGEVYLIPKSDLTLSGTSGSIPFTVVNQLPQTVKLGLSVQTSRTGLHVTQIPVRKFATGSTTVEVKVTAEAPGAKVTVTAFLINATGAHYGTEASGGSQSLQVTVTSIGFVALLLFAGSVALLIFAVGLRIYRGRKGSRGEPATHEGE